MTGGAVKKGARELEIKQDLVFQRREWAVQRIGWWILTAFVVAALLGLFGGGPLSSARAGHPDAPLRVEYERFVRVGAPTRLTLRGNMTGLTPRSGLRLRIRRDYFEAFRVERIAPEPASIAIGDEEVDLHFGADAVGSGLFTIIFEIEPVEPGLQGAAFRVNDAAGVTFRQLTYF
jgi:hypothetical protein